MDVDGCLNPMMGTATDEVEMEDNECSATSNERDKDSKLKVEEKEVILKLQAYAKRLRDASKDVKSNVRSSGTTLPSASLRRSETSLKDISIFSPIPQTQEKPWSLERYQSRESKQMRSARITALVHHYEREKQARARVCDFLQQHGFGFDPTAQRRHWCGCSFTCPLHVAVVQNDPEITVMLIRAGSDPDQVDSRGRTPLRLASELNNNGSHGAVAHALRTTRRSAEVGRAWLTAAPISFMDGGCSQLHWEEFFKNVAFDTLVGPQCHRHRKGLP